MKVLTIDRTHTGTGWFVL